MKCGGGNGRYRKTADHRKRVIKEAIQDEKVAHIKTSMLVSAEDSIKDREACLESTKVSPEKITGGRRQKIKMKTAFIFKYL